MPIAKDVDIFLLNKIDIPPWIAHTLLVHGVKVPISFEHKAQSYITEICYYFSHQFRAIYDLITFLAPLGFFFSKDPPICPNSHERLTKIEIRSSWKLVRTLFRITQLAPRKSYLVIYPNSHEKLTKSKIMKSWESVRTLLRITRLGHRKSNLVIICPNSQDKRPVGLIAPPFKINFLATENWSKMKLKSVRILLKIIHLASGSLTFGQHFIAQNHK